MNRIKPASPYRVPGIRAAALAVLLFAVLLFAVVGSQQAAAGPVALTYAEAAAWMQAETVGWAEWSESHHRNAHASAHGTTGSNAPPLSG